MFSFVESGSSSEELERLLVFAGRRRHTIFDCDWGSDVCSSDLRPERVKPKIEITRPEQAAAPAVGPAARRGNRFESRDPRPLALGANRRAAFVGDVLHRVCLRSEERRVGKERRSRWSPDHYTNT